MVDQHICSVCGLDSKDHGYPDSYPGCCEGCDCGAWVQDDEDSDASNTTSREGVQE